MAAGAQGRPSSCRYHRRQPNFPILFRRPRSAWDDGFAIHDSDDARTLRWIGAAQRRGPRVPRRPASPAARPLPRATRSARPAGRRMRFIERPYCERLGTPFEADLEAPGLLSPDAIAHPPVFARARAVARFDDGPSRQLVHRLKYGDRLELAGTMGAWMARAGEEILAEADVLVPVPLHRRRLAARRFNQSALLARAISRGCGVPLAVDALARGKATASQVGLSRTQRQLNLQGAFAVPARAARGRRRSRRGAGRRRAHLRRHRQCRLAGAPARRGSPRRRAVSSPAWSRAGDIQVSRHAGDKRNGCCHMKRARRTRWRRPRS